MTPPTELEGADWMCQNVPYRRDVGLLRIRLRQPVVALLSGALIHELGHAIVAALLYRTPVLVTDNAMMPAAMCTIFTDTEKSHSNDMTVRMILMRPVANWLVTVAGPLANIFAGLLLMSGFNAAVHINNTPIAAVNMVLVWFGALHIVLGAINMTPITSDGLTIMYGLIGRKPPKSKKMAMIDQYIRDIFGTTGCEVLNLTDAKQARKVVNRTVLRAFGNKFFGVGGFTGIGGEPEDPLDAIAKVQNYPYIPDPEPPLQPVTSVTQAPPWLTPG